MDSQNPENRKSALIFLGTGCSNTVPFGTCIIQPSDPPCSVCFHALSLPPHLNPNYRCNTSLLIDYCPNGDDHCYILIDIGKTFREQVLRWFTFHKIPRLDSILLTHEHADAVLGLDDICAVVPCSSADDDDPIRIYLTQFTMDSVASRFPYLISGKAREGEIRKVAKHLDWKIIEGHCQRPFVASGIEFVPLPVMHGKDYVSLGFLFGLKSKVAYISDLSHLPVSTEYAMGAGQLDLLILEASRKHGPSGGAHFTLSQSLEAVERLRPKQALFTGMGHEFDHDKDNEFLSEWSKRVGIPVQLAHDGLRISIDL